MKLFNNKKQILKTQLQKRCKNRKNVDLKKLNIENMLEQKNADFNQSSMKKLKKY